MMKFLFTNEDCNAKRPDPQRSIPSGTATAYIFAILHILVLTVLLAGSSKRDALIQHTDTILADICYSRMLVPTPGSMYRNRIETICP